MKRKQLATALAAVGFGMAIAGSASAGIAVFAPIWAFEDNDLEFIYDLDSSGTISKGDRVVTAGEFGATQGVFPGQNLTPIGPEELTFVADHTIVTAISGGGGTTTQFVLRPTVGGLTSAYGADVMAAIFVDPTADLDVSSGVCGTHTGIGTPATDCMLAAGLGATTVPGSGPDGSTLWALIGYGADPDNLWITDVIPNTGLSLAAIQTGGASTEFVGFNYNMTVLLNNTGVNIAPNTIACAPFCAPGGDGFADVAGSGNLLGGQGMNAANWTGRSDNDVQVGVQVPEPGSLALLGVALAGLAGVRRRKESKA